MEDKSESNTARRFDNKGAQNYRSQGTLMLLMSLC